MLWWILSCVGVFDTILVVAFCHHFIFALRSRQATPFLPGENVFMEHKPNQQEEPHKVSFGSIHLCPPEVTLSVIIPAYNEERRIKRMLDETLQYLKARQDEQTTFSFEVLVVDDGSSDNTASVVMEYVAREGSDIIRLLQLLKNRGKGGAVKRGMLCARGSLLLMADADGATRFSDIQKLENAIQHIGPFAVAVGSRAHLQEQCSARRSFLRNFLMHGFHLLVSLLCVQGVQDTQCGFKLFPRRAASILFANQHIERWAFDVELLYLASRLKIPVQEAAVDWKEVEGSKLDPFLSSLQMARDLLRIRLMYAFRLWRISTDTP